MKKVYYYLMFKQESPLRIGNGLHEESDSDLMLDGRGLPFIPGTSLAGLFRHKAKELGMLESTENHLFGIVKNSRDESYQGFDAGSSILFGDAVIDCNGSKENVKISRRDGVGLNEWGTAKRTSKFDFQIAETDYCFNEVIEWEGNDEEYVSEIDQIIEPLIKHYIAEGISVGARTTRGFGKCALSARKKVFNFPEMLNEWSDFNQYESKYFENAEAITGERQNDISNIEILFKFVSPFAVRVNMAKTELMPDGSVPDSVPLENYKGNPVIPGTAWAGSFRHHMHTLLRDTGVIEGSEKMQEIDKVFGVSNNSPLSTGRSKLSFCESEIAIQDKETQCTSMMRTAIDRFTSAPRTAALFTSRVYFGGDGKLTISYDERHVPEAIRELLCACICDMHIGFLTVGGESSVGKGRMRIVKLKFNGKDITERMNESIDNGKPLDWFKGV